MSSGQIKDVEPNVVYHALLGASARIRAVQQELGRATVSPDLTERQRAFIIAAAESIEITQRLIQLGLRVPR